MTMLWNRASCSKFGNIFMLTSDKRRLPTSDLHLNAKFLTKKCQIAHFTTNLKTVSNNTDIKATKTGVLKVQSTDHHLDSLFTSKWKTSMPNGFYCRIYSFLVMKMPFEKPCDNYKISQLEKIDLHFSNIL